MDWFDNKKKDGLVHVKYPLRVYGRRRQLSSSSIKTQKMNQIRPESENFRMEWCVASRQTAGGPLNTARAQG